MCCFPDITTDHIGLHPGNQFTYTAASVCDQILTAIFRNCLDNLCHSANRFFICASGNPKNTLYQCFFIRFLQIDHKIHSGNDRLVHLFTASIIIVGCNNDGRIRMTFDHFPVWQKNTVAPVKKGWCGIKKVDILFSRIS